MTDVGNKGTFKRDFLVAIERQMQQQWQEERLFEQDAPADGSQEEKFMVTFPYPYMNGRLHLGHSFSLSKAEFAAAYERLRGKRTLFPFAFHCTGMPIVAAAEKLRKEIAQFGCPPQFPADDSSCTSGGAKHSKVAAKTGGVKYQWQIMQALDIPDAEIPNFQDPLYWTQFFPPLATDDLRQLGCGIDWRRSFITTDANPFYNAFIEWQFRKLYRQGKIKFGKRNTIFSPLDGQPCLDHDRASGEGVDPKEYTCIKIRMLDFDARIDRAYAGKQVYLVAATLRPETMYGQTNVWIGPDVTYGVFDCGDNESFYVCTERSARNMAHQNAFKLPFGKFIKVRDVKGSELIGIKCSGPLAIHDVFHVLPMLTVSANIGTGVVTSVPSSSPDDFACLRDLREKPALRQKFSVHDDWVLPFAPYEVCKTPSLTDASASCAAEFACNKFGVKSQNDRDALDKAKELVYKEEFYQGLMAVGPYVGEPVQQVKPKIQQGLIEAGQAFMYHEPERKVISRSGDECVVALTDQWFLAYGEPEWREQAELCLQRLECFMPEVRNQFEQTLGWMQQWACSRSFGLGTKLPWDPKYVIESLSDSTIYMAFYTIAHILHAGSLDGSTSPNGIRPEQMTDDVWEYVFGNDHVPFPSDSGLSSELLARMRREFRYFYGFDLRVSGKDLVPNHLTMSIYNHVAMWPDEPERWPHAMRANGHLLLNSEKMSKSTGNFLTMRQANDKFGADATRIALADAGDSVEDANFVQETADKSILRLYASHEQLTEFLQSQGDGSRAEDAPLRTIDRVFLSEMARCVRNADGAYQRMEYREALKEALFELQNSRDFYRDVCKAGPRPHAGVMRTFFEWQCRVLAPITPHFSDYAWRHVLKKPSTVLTGGMPNVEDVLSNQYGIVDADKYLAVGAYLRKSAHELRLSMGKNAKPNAQLLVASQFPAWQEAAIDVLRSHFDAATGKFTLEDAAVVQAIRTKVQEVEQGKSMPKKLIPFAMEVKKRMLETYPAHEHKVLNRKLPFDELAVLADDGREYLRQTLGLAELTVVLIDKPNQPSPDGSTPPPQYSAAHENVMPGQPGIRFV